MFFLHKCNVELLFLAMCLSGDISRKSFPEKPCPEMLDDMFKHDFSYRAKKVEEIIMYQKCVGIRYKKWESEGDVPAPIL